jgi:hypothetical protein
LNDRREDTINQRTDDRALDGSYLAACVFLATLLKRNPVGVEFGSVGLDKRDMAVLQDAAWNCGFSGTSS